MGDTDLIEPLGDLLWIEPEEVSGEKPLIMTPERWQPKPAMGHVVRPSAEVEDRWPPGSRVVFRPDSLMEMTIDKRRILLLSAGEILARVA